MNKVWYRLLGLWRNLTCRSGVLYVSEGANWVIKDIGDYLTQQFQKVMPYNVTFHHWFLGSKIVHYGSINTCFYANGTLKALPKHSKKIVTWYHIAQDDNKLNNTSALNHNLDTIVVTHESMRQTLLKAGIWAEKIKLLPMGIDTLTYNFADNKEKIKQKSILGIPKDTFVVGSFQKDGGGWGEGLEPKLIKGPDIFCDVIESVAKKHNIYVVLTGPARGYVKKRLDNANISYTHTFLQKSKEVVAYYHALDAYMVSSRAEGGPMAILESWATGTPLIATKVGIISDLATHGENALLSEVGDSQDLANNLKNLIASKQLQEHLRIGGVRSVQKNAWPLVAKQFKEKLYDPLLG
jgi:glycosyltransferase involved in cell wall biosynthesis